MILSVILAKSPSFSVCMGGSKKLEILFYSNEREVLAYIVYWILEISYHRASCLQQHEMLFSLYFMQIQTWKLGGLMCSFPRTWLWQWEAECVVAKASLLLDQSCWSSFWTVEGQRHGPLTNACFRLCLSHDCAKSRTHLFSRQFIVTCTSPMCMSSSAPWEGIQKCTMEIVWNIWGMQIKCTFKQLIASMTLIVVPFM